jgi:competence protein ComFC
MKQLLSNIPKAALNLILPLSCYGCKASLPYDSKIVLCENCFKKITSSYASSCQLPSRSSHIEKIYNCCVYKDTVKELIHKFKYEKKLQIKAVLIDILDFFLKSKLISEKIDFITAVPMYPADFRKRGFNQSALLAEGLAVKTNIRFENTLIKIRKTEAQVLLKKIDRVKNMKDAFTCKKLPRLKDKTVLIIDDVFTTGSTLNECAKTLKAYGVETVFALALARGI